MNQPDRVRVTFVWRGSPDTTSARAFNIPMTHLTGTDVWHATMAMPKDHRVWYSIVANTAGSASDPVPDPLNPHRVVPPIAAERPAAAAAAVDMPAVVNSSIVVLPDTPASPWVDPSNPPRQCACALLGVTAFGASRQAVRAIA